MVFEEKSAPIGDKKKGRRKGGGEDQDGKFLVLQGGESCREGEKESRSIITGEKRVIVIDRDKKKRYYSKRKKRFAVNGGGREWLSIAIDYKGGGIN